MRVKFLTDEKFEAAAFNLYSSHFNRLGQPISKPIPIEDIIEFHLKLKTPLYDDLSWIAEAVRTPVEEIIGALDVNNQQIYVSSEAAEHSGRCRFTLAHETGHWVLHRSLYYHDKNQTDLFSDQRNPDIVCRADKAYDRIEYQANRFAACVLMPKELVLSDLAGLAQEYERPLSQMLSLLVEGDFPEICDALAEIYDVSKQAFKIRIETLAGGKHANRDVFTDSIGNPKLKLRRS